MRPACRAGLGVCDPDRSAMLGGRIDIAHYNESFIVRKVGEFTIFVPQMTSARRTSLYRSMETNRGDEWAVARQFDVSPKAAAVRAKVLGLARFPE
jgi:hypothetical protein